MMELPIVLQVHVPLWQRPLASHRWRARRFAALLIAISLASSVASSARAQAKNTPGSAVPNTGANSVDEKKAQAIIASVKPAVVMLEIETERGMAWGSGFFVSSDGLLVTNHHVVRDAQKVTCLWKNKDKLSAKVLSTDKQYDLAIVKVEVPAPVPTVALGDSESVQAGQLIAVTGYPQPSLMVWMGMALDSSTSRGSINGIRFGGDVHTFLGDTSLQIDAPVTHGNSGGPMFSVENGEVLGVLSSGIAGAGNVTFAIPINRAKVMIATLNAKIQPRTVTAESPEAAVEPGDLRVLNTISVSKELPRLFGYSFPFTAQIQETALEALSEWEEGTGKRPSRVTAMVMQGEDIFFGCTDGKLRRWNVGDRSMSASNAEMLLDVGRDDMFIYPPAVNQDIICVSAGALDTSLVEKNAAMRAMASYLPGIGGLFGKKKIGVNIEGRGQLLGLNRRNGNIDWQYDAGFVGTPQMHNGKVFYGGLGERGCLDAFSGKEVWRTGTKSSAKADWYHIGYAGEQGLFGIAVPIEGKRQKDGDDSSRIGLLGNGKARVERYDPASDKVLWKVEIGDVAKRPSPLATAMFFDPEKKVIYALAAQVVAAISLEGQVLWIYDHGKKMEEEFKAKKGKLSVPSFTSHMVIRDGKIYIGSQDRKLYAFNGADGQLLWTYNTRGEVGHPSYHEGMLIVGSGDGYVHAVDATSGKINWRVYINAPVSGPPLVHEGMVYVATESGQIYTIRIPLA